MVRSLLDDQIDLNVDVGLFYFREDTIVAELWDVYDIDGNKTGRLHERGKPMSAGDSHLVVHIWILNSNGEFLISKRANWPEGMWQTTGGCAIMGDDGLTAALRETKEELGIELKPEDGLLFKHYSEPHNDDEGMFLVDAWVFRLEVDISTIVYQAGETCDAMWASPAKIRCMIEDGAFLGRWYSYIDELFSACDIPGFDDIV